MEDIRNKIIADAKDVMNKHPQLRYGQCVYNVAECLVPEKTLHIVNTSNDCFFDDKLVDRFLDAVCKGD